MPIERRIDVHHHFYPPEYLKGLSSGSGADRDLFPGVTNWTPQRTIDEMDKHGVTTAVLSLSPPGCQTGARSENAAMARLCGEYAAGMRRDHPGRFGIFAPMPMPDVDATIEAIEYAFHTLKADGIALMTSYGDKWPGDPAFDPVFDELNRRKAVVYIHPMAPRCCSGMMGWVPDAIVEYPHDTNRCIVSLLFSGTVARCPDIRFIFCHGGGSIPMLAGRIGHSGSNRPYLPRVPKGVDYELEKLHYDVALAAWRPSLLALFDYVPMSQILLGSDYPFSSVGVSIQGLEAMDLPEESLGAICHGNAERLMSGLATRARK